MSQINPFICDLVNVCLYVFCIVYLLFIVYLFKCYIFKSNFQIYINTGVSLIEQSDHFP